MKRDTELKPKRRFGQQVQVIPTTPEWAEDKTATSAQKKQIDEWNKLFVPAPPVKNRDTKVATPKRVFDGGYNEKSYHLTAPKRIKKI